MQPAFFYLVALHRTISDCCPRNGGEHGNRCRRLSQLQHFVGVTGSTLSPHIGGRCLDKNSLKTVYLVT